MMNYEGFKEEVKNNIKDFLPDRFADAKVEIIENYKLNESYDGLTVRIPDISIAPAININQMYKEYEATENFDHVMNRIGTIIADKTPLQEPKLDFVTDYSKVKEKLFLRLSNLDNSKKVLDKIVHRNMEDIVVSAAIQIQNFDGQLGTVTVTNELLKNYGITEDQLFKDALENSSKIMPAKVESMNKLLSRMMGIPEEELMSSGMLFPDNSLIVVSNECQINGASAILYPEVQEELANTIGGDYVILPSSIHEVIVAPVGLGGTREELEDMIQHINVTEVADEDVLSKHAFLYDSIDKCIVRMDKAVEHKWYAVLSSEYDNDWEYGSYNKEDAFNMCKQMNDRHEFVGNPRISYIAEIDNYKKDNPVCINEYHDKEVNEYLAALNENKAEKSDKTVKNIKHKEKEDETEI